MTLRIGPAKLSFLQHRKCFVRTDLDITKPSIKWVPRALFSELAAESWNSYPWPRVERADLQIIDVWQNIVLIWVCRRDIYFISIYIFSFHNSLSELDITDSTTALSCSPRVKHGHAFCSDDWHTLILTHCHSISSEGKASARGIQYMLEC